MIFSVALQIIFADLISEDLGLLVSWSYIQNKSIPANTALLVNVTTVVLADLFLFSLGRLASKANWNVNFLKSLKQKIHQKRKPSYFATSTLAARVVPGMRILGHISSGYFGYELRWFLPINTLGVLLWQFFAIYFGVELVNQFGLLSLVFNILGILLVRLALTRFFKAALNDS